MKLLKYKVELLTDIILNQKAATEGANTTLDFIPGGCFLGVVARKIYKENCKEDNLTIFHSGKVRFGDAHPAHGDVRTLRVPAMMMHPKLNNDTYYISAKLPEDEKYRKELRELQLKQCRTGFYDFSQNPAPEVKTDTSFAIKSAYDRQHRTSLKNAMYGYESLRKGLTLFFEVEVDDESLATIINDAIVGTKHIGRSRSAQYGLVKIQRHDDFKSINKTMPIKDDTLYIYADGRLIFLDDNGLPTFRPTAKDLGIENGEIDWKTSQVRTFQYAPWNGQRQCFDTDRCGIEKGSVFVVKCNGGLTSVPSPQYIGSYRNEGFGKVLYNPAFLTPDENDQLGKAVYQLKKAEKEKEQETNTDATKSPLLNYLRLEQKEANITSNIYDEVEKWVAKNSGLFISKDFASQWGTIRALASIRKTEKTVWNMLFEKEDGYLEHGIAKDKWDEGGRKKKLQEFINGLPENMDNEDVRLAVVNLAAEMAKRCRKKEEKQ